MTQPLKISFYEALKDFVSDDESADVHGERTDIVHQLKQPRSVKDLIES